MKRPYPLAFPSLLVAIAFSLGSVDAHADSIRTITMSNLTFVGTDVCSPSPCTDIFSASLVWDATTNTLVSWKTTNSGPAPLGSLPPPYPVFGGQFGPYCEFFLFPNGGGSASAAILWYFNAPGSPPFPNTGTYPISDVYIVCVSGNALCQSEFTSFPHAVSGKITITPEPSTIVLIASGLFLLLAFRHHLRVRPLRGYFE
jgi:hypothetical protein